MPTYTFIYNLFIISIILLNYIFCWTVDWVFSIQHRSAVLQCWLFGLGNVNMPSPDCPPIKRPFLVLPNHLHLCSAGYRIWDLGQHGNIAETKSHRHRNCVSTPWSRYGILIYVDIDAYSLQCKHLVLSYACRIRMFLPGSYFIDEEWQYW